MAVHGGVELNDLVLTGPRLTLRPWEPGDAGDVLQACSHPSTARYLHLPAPYTAGDAEAFVSRIGNAGRRAGTGLGAALVETAGGRFVGAAELRLEDDHDIGYWVAPTARGQGYAAEATRVLAAWAFAHGQDRVQLFCDVRNLASARTALAAGFTFEGVQRAASHAVVADESGPRRPDQAQFARLATDPSEPVRPRLAPLPEGGLRDGTVLLRCLAPEDAQPMTWTDDELTLRWAFSAEPHTFAQARRAAEGAALEWLVGTTAALAVVDIATGEFAGSIRLRHAGPPGVGGLGYVLRPEFRGRGLTVRALRLLADWAFREAGFARLELGAKTGNVASQRVARQAGFQPEGTLPGRLRNPDGSYSDEARFGLLRPAP